MPKRDRQQHLGSPIYTPLKDGKILVNSIFDSNQNEVIVTVNKLHTQFMNYINCTHLKVRISLEFSQLRDTELEFTPVKKWKPCVEFSDQFAFTLLDNFHGPYELKLRLLMQLRYGTMSETGRVTLPVFIGKQSPAAKRGMVSMSLGLSQIDGSQKR